MTATVINAVTTSIRALADWNGNHSLTWNSHAYTVLVSRLSKAARLQIGGTFSEYAGRVLLALRDFQTEDPPGTWTTGSLPEAGQWVTLAGAQYRILRIEQSDYNPVITVHLGHGDNPLQT